MQVAFFAQIINLGDREIDSLLRVQGRIPEPFFLTAPGFFRIKSKNRGANLGMVFPVSRRCHLPEPAAFIFLLLKARKNESICSQAA